MTSPDLLVCKELDDLTLRMFELMEEQLQNTTKMATVMKRGFIDIAKARYIMGNRSLSTLQLPGSNSPEFTALSTVKLEQGDCGNPSFVLNTVPKLKPRPKETEHLRKRIKDDKDDIPEKTDISDASVEETVKVVDPLRWFGLLVPQNLRLAQTGFTSTLELVTQSANIQLELESTRERYNALQQKKTCSKPAQVSDSNDNTDNRKPNSKKKNKKISN